jgi:hypothetical protein
MNPTSPNNLQDRLANTITSPISPLNFARLAANTTNNSPNDFSLTINHFIKQKTNSSILDNYYSDELESKISSKYENEKDN